MTDLAHRDLELRLNEAREDYQAALDASQLELADQAYARMDELLEQYIHLPQQRNPQNVPAPPTNA